MMAGARTPYFTLARPTSTLKVKNWAIAIIATRFTKLILLTSLHYLIVRGVSGLYLDAIVVALTSHALTSQVIIH